MPQLFNLLALCLYLPCAIAVAQDQGWPSYGADLANTKYSTLTQINRDNFSQLQVAWRWQPAREDSLRQHADVFTWINQATPIVVGDTLFTSTPFNQVAALDAQSGEVLWSYDPEAYKHSRIFTHRGVSYWTDGADRRILFGTGDAHLNALDATTGTPVPSFGVNGRVDLTQGLRRPVEDDGYDLHVPPLIVGDIAIVGCALSDYQNWHEMPSADPPPGDVRAFDVRTGEQLWVFQTIPQQGEYGNETWEEGSWKRAGNTNVWTVMSADPELGYVYLPVSTPINDLYGGERLGDNLFGDSIVCLDIKTGQRVWHYQLVHHGLWDYDPPSAPNLVDIVVDGRPIKAVAQVTKQGFCYVFDRVTGEPVWPIDEKPVPPSTVPGERASPTQPFPSKPPPFERQGLSEDDFIDFTPELRQEALEIAAQYDYGPLFTPPTEKGILALPGQWGGANWSGAAVHPDKGIIYIPSITFPMPHWLTKTADKDAPYAYYGNINNYLSGPRGLPLTKPPYGRITAIDLHQGEHAWMQPVGEGPRDHPALSGLNLPPLGWRRRIFVLLTESLLFAPQAGRRPEEVDFGPGMDDDPYLWAFDPDSGETIGHVELPGNAHGAPITYMSGGKQYIVVPIGGFFRAAEWVALNLPD